MEGHRDQLLTDKEMKRMIVNLHIFHLINLRAIKMLIIKIMQEHSKHSPEDKVDSAHLVVKECVLVEFECEY